MDSTLARVNAINKLRDELEELSSPHPFHRLGESEFQKWDFFHRNSALIIKKLFGENSQYLRDWLKIEIPEDPDIEDDKGFSTYLHKQGIAEEKMENQLEIMAKEITLSEPTQQKQTVKKQGIDTKRVFIVHGADNKPVKELKTILQTVNLKPILLSDQPSSSMTIIEKLEKYSNVDFAFVVLTPDDIGVSFKELFIKASKCTYEEKALQAAKRILAQSKGSVERFIEYNERFVNDPDDVMSFLEILRSRARQNVILEFGYFVGKLGRKKVCCLVKGTLEQPSDMQGIVYIPFIKSLQEVKDKILKELETAGFDLKPKLSEKCRNCGEPLEPNMKGCPKCGSKDRDIAVFDQSRGQDS